MKFTIDSNSLCQITIREEWSEYDRIPLEELTHEQLIRMIKGLDRRSSNTIDDHPEFKSLRNTLEAEGFIECRRGWWNGDRVLKSFTLNGAKFFKDEKFACGAAIKYDVIQKQKDKKYRTI